MPVPVPEFLTDPTTSHDGGRLHVPRHGTFVQEMYSAMYFKI